MNDEEYKQKLIAHGVKEHFLVGRSSKDLDNIGNLVDCYRTSMKEQNPARYEILCYMAMHRDHTR